MWDWSSVKTFRIDIFGDPGTLCGVIRHVKRLDKDLVIFQRRQRDGFEGEGLIGTREFREMSRFVGENPLAGFCWARHGRVLKMKLKSGSNWR